MKLEGPTPWAGREGSWYALDGVPVPRVSTLLDAIASPELERYKRRGLWSQFKKGASYDQAISHAETTLNALGQRGTSIHTLIELGEGDKLGEVKAAAAAIVDLFGGQTIATEQSIVRVEDGVPLYAGTLDLRAYDLDDAICICDWKSGTIGTRPFLRHLLQITAYAEASHYVEGDGSLRIIEMEDRPTRGVIVGLKQDGSYTAHVVDLGPLNDGAAALRGAVRALVEIYKLRAMYGTGSGFAATMKGGNVEW